MELMESYIQRKLKNDFGFRINIKYYFIILLPIITEVGCLNPFAPKLDTNLSSQTCNDLTQVENVLCTFRNAYTFKDTTLYSTILSSNFSFTYRDYDHGVDVSWGRVDEMRTTYSLFQNVQSLTLIWNNEISSNGDDTTHTTVRGFNLTVTFNPSDIIRVDGYANITLQRAKLNDAWKITHWRDESNF